jgi:hypothetical protein
VTWTSEQRRLVETPVLPSGDQTPAQALNVTVESFKQACWLAGYEPIPPEQEIREALISVSPSLAGLPSEAPTPAQSDETEADETSWTPGEEKALRASGFTYYRTGDGCTYRVSHAGPWQVLSFGPKLWRGTTLSERDYETLRRITATEAHSAERATEEAN